MIDDRILFPDNHPADELLEPQDSDRIAERFKNPPKKQRAVKAEQDPEYLTALAKLVDATNYRPRLTARQQYILELVKEQIRVSTLSVEEATRRAIVSADIVFGE